MKKSLSAELVEVARWMGEQGWCSATSGNLSARIDENDVLITISGRHKAHLTEQDFLLVDLDGKPLDCRSTPSAETLLHTQLYRLDNRINAVLHSHSVAATVVSRMNTGSELLLSGYEMQKALSGNHSHLPQIRIEIMDNDQDMKRLAGALAHRWQREPLRWGLLIRGHGLYAWGKDVGEARRHLEGLEFLLACEMEMNRFSHKGIGA